MFTEGDRARLRLYAEAGVPEVWIIGLPGDRIEVHRAPRRRRYEATVTVGRGAAVSPEAYPEVWLAAADILG